MKKKLLSFFFAAFFSIPIVSSNNIQVSNVSISGNYINFDLSWENSWNDDVNYDAAWVFVKFRYPNDDWLHVTLSTSGHTLSSGSAVDMPGDGKGIFIYRTTPGVGNNSFNGFELNWNIAADGISSTSNLQVAVFAIEMVYIPQGSFWVGDSTAFNCFIRENSNSPVLISTDAVIIKHKNANLNYEDYCMLEGCDDEQFFVNGILVDGDEGIDKDGVAIVDNTGYPTGYESFYCMKYEISQGQYADFLNTITSIQEVNRYPNQYGTDGFTITGAWPNYEADAPDRACNYLSWMDGCAYADWAGLRPMTELEFEKAARGSLEPFPDEYAWGNTNISDNDYVISAAGTENEIISNPEVHTGNANFDNNIQPPRPLRCGIFSASAINKTRMETGATFYGIMEISGNLEEQCITLGNSDGRNFTGIDGDGIISGGGFANQENWPHQVAGAVTNSIGINTKKWVV